MEPLPNQPRECKLAPTSLTQEKLNELRQEIARKGVSKNPLDYEHPETEFKKTDTLSDVLGKIFGKKGHGIPQGTAERIELALLTNGVDFSKLKADHWKVERGKLIFLRDEKGQSKEVFVINLLPWKALEVKPESKETLGSHYYDLGVYKGAAPLSREAGTIEGSVDATAHYDKLRKSSWYKDKKETTELLLKIFDGDRTRFTPQTIAVIQSKEAILRALASQTDFTPSKFCKNFEKKYTFDQIAGAYGVYNIVLSFQRVLDLYGKNPDALQNDKTQIALFIGTHVKFQEERYAKAYAVTREEPGIDEPGIVCPPEDTTAPPPPPEPPGPPGPPEPPGPPGPPEPPPPVWPSSEKEEAHLLVTTRPGELARTAEQFDERLSPDIMSDALIRGYTTYGINAFLGGINKIPPDKRATVLDNVFKRLGEEDPARAENLIQEIVFGMRDNLKANVTHALAENIDRSSGDEKKVWELQQMLFEQQEAGGDPEKLKLVFEKLDSINPNNLPPELKEMYETQKRTLEFFVKRSVGTDLVESALAVLESTLPEGDKKDIQKLIPKSDAEIRKALRNEGATEWLDNDEEVYLASAHVLEALRLAIFYVYPEDIKKGEKIDNPVSYYYNLIKTGKLSEIVIQKDYPPPVVSNPLARNCVSGNRIDLNKLFIDLDSEIRLFEKYQSGKESLGEHSIWNLYEGNAGAFLGEDISEAGLIDGSDKIFSQGNLFERGGELGVSEKVYMARIKNLMALNRNDEARDLCIAVLEKRLAEEKPLSDAEIEARTDELSKDYMTKIRAQARLELAAQGIDEKNVKSKNISRPSGGFYQNIDEYITDIARERLKERAYIELQSNVGEQIFDADKDRSSWSVFENSVFDEFKELNGYGFFDIREETASLIGDISKVVAEIVVIELATAGVGAFVAGAAGAARVGVYGHRGLDVAHASRTTEHAARLGGRFGRTRMGRPFGRLARPAQYLEQGATWHARGARTLLHSATFVEAQAALHGEVVNPASKEGAWYIGTMALTFWGLDKVQQFMRGGLASGMVAQRALVRGPAPTAMGRLGEKLNPVVQLGQLSNWVGSRTGDLALRGRAGYAGISAMEYATEVAALQYLGSAETYLAVQTGMISTVEAEAMEEPEKARQWAHTAAVVLGLRTWRHVQRRLLPPPEPPPPIPPPPPPPPEGPRLLGPGRPAHDVDIIANNISKIRDPTGFPRGKVQVGDRFYNLHHALRLRAGNRTLKSQYEEASRMPEGEPKIQELMRLDRLAASRLILASGGIVEYKTMAEAEQARDALLAEYPRRGITIYERDGKTYLTIWKAHEMDWRTPNPAGGPASPGSPGGSSEAAASAAAAAPETPVATPAAAAGAAPSAGPTSSPSRSARRGKEAHVDEFAYAMAEARSKGTDWIPRGMKIRVSEFDLKVGKKTLADLYEEASKLPQGTQAERDFRLARFAEVDRFAAERILVSRNQNVEYRAREQAEQALTGLTRDFPERLFVIEEVSGKVLLRNYPTHDVDFIAKLISENRFDNGVAGKKGIPAGKLQIGKNRYSFEKGMGFRAGEKTLREQYEEALNIGDEAVRSDRLSKLDRLLASRMIVQNGMAAKYTGVEGEKEVGEARTGISSDFPRSGYEVAEHDGKPVLYRRG